MAHHILQFVCMDVFYTRRLVCACVGVSCKCPASCCAARVLLVLGSFPVNSLARLHSLQQQCTVSWRGVALLQGWAGAGK